MFNMKEFQKSMDRAVRQAKININHAVETLGPRRLYSPKTTIIKVIYNEPATIVFFADGEKVVVKCNNEEFDYEKGVAMAVMRRLYTRSEFKRIVEEGEEQVENEFQRWLRGAEIEEEEI